MKKGYLVNFPEDVYYKLKQFALDRDEPMSQTVIMATNMFIDAINRTEAEQLALFENQSV